MITPANAALAILVPFYRDDPSPLVAALAEQAAALTETPPALVLYDDGGGDGALVARVRAALDAYPGQSRLIVAGRNRGRAAARNALTDAAGDTPYLLFLDADMVPDGPDFLVRWMEELRQRPDVCFGGFTAPESCARERALHRAFSVQGDCVNAAVRMRNPAQYVFTSNLLVRAQVLRDVAFDNGFSGWGWEDSEWAARVRQSFAIRHIDNPAVHLGLETADCLLARFRDSAGNYARFVTRHPELAASLASYAWAQRLKRVPAARLARPLLAALARGAAPAPMKLRVLALKLWRASWYSEAL